MPRPPATSSLCLDLRGDASSHKAPDAPGPHGVHAAPHPNVLEQEIPGPDQLPTEDLLALKQRIDTVLQTRGHLPAVHASTSQACRFFSVAEGVRALTADQLTALSAAFEAWIDRARDERIRRSRERVHLVYLLLRHTGARLGEVLALDERGDIDYARHVVQIRERQLDISETEEERKPREVPVPPEVTARIRTVCARYQTTIPMPGEDHAERLFDLDPGFVRRKFQEQSAASGIPKDLLSPSVLRATRTVELLRGGLPLRAAQSFLGHTRMDATASFVDLNEADVKHIIKNHLAKEQHMQTSARNTFTGTVTSVISSEVVTEVVLKTESGLEVVSVITNESRDKLNLAEGRTATALVKAHWVILEKADSPTPTSARNAFPGKVTSVTSDGVVAEIQGELSDGTPVCAVVTEGSVKKLGIATGGTFVFLFKVSAVILS